jgi:hypothetical protein
MSEPDLSGDVAGADPDAADPTMAYDPNEDQDTEPSNMAPPGERPSDMDSTD